MQQSHGDGPSPFPLIVSLVLTGYLAAVTFLLGREAVTEADHAVQHLLWVVVGAAALVTFCLGMRSLDARPTAPERSPRSSEDA